MTTYDDTDMSKIFHPLLALIASSTDRELAKYVQYLKEENKILRARLPRQVHTTHEERNRLLTFGKAVDTQRLRFIQADMDVTKQLMAFLTS